MSVRHSIVSLVTIFLWMAHDSDAASGQSPELPGPIRSDLSQFVGTWEPVGGNTDDITRIDGITSQRSGQGSCLSLTTSIR